MSFERGDRVCYRHDKTQTGTIERRATVGLPAPIWCVKWDSGQRSLSWEQNLERLEESTAAGKTMR